MDKILEVNNLKISFRTQGGTVKAVRDISFGLERGETLAIVGESGSGKSVTSKAILGILAGNSIVEGGEILYDGKDLLKISEEDMHKIRGDKIAMIFQDPLSSLNPIVKIGKQITEAMLLKNKAARRVSKKEFSAILELLRENMIQVMGTESETKVKEIIETFDKFNVEGNRLAEAYNAARNRAEELVAECDELNFLIEKKQKINVKEKLGEFIKTLPQVKNAYLLDAEMSSSLDEIIKQFNDARSKYNEKDESTRADVGRVLSSLDDFLQSQVLKRPHPDFFRIGYYMLKNPDAKLTEMEIDELNEMTLAYLNENFMKEFLTLETAAIKHSYAQSLEGKRKVLAAMPAVRSYFADGKLDKKSAGEQAKAISALVNASIDRLETIKDSTTYTFATALENAIEKYFFAVVNNPKEEARFAKQSKKREALIAKGKTVDWKVVPKTVYDLNELIANILKLIDNLSAKFEHELAHADEIDMDARAIALIDYLKDKAAQVVYSLTPRMAKEKAIKLMDEVGIPEPRIRFNQYPFQCSGGMRQRIVIAIALSADPDVLICDEPTTALDVTIQAQILELINRLKRERNLSVIFITHDLGVVANIADRIAVMYAGKIVEYGTADDLFYDPRHPYTWALLSSMPDLDTNEKLEAIPGTPPNMIYPPVGDAFAARNKYALKIDFEQQPPQFEVSPTHWAATWLLHPDAPKVEPPRIITDRIERMKGGDCHD